MGWWRIISSSILARNELERHNPIILLLRVWIQRRLALREPVLAREDVRVRVTVGKPLDKFAHKLVQGRPHCLGACARTADKLLVGGKCDSHNRTIGYCWGLLQGIFSRRVGRNGFSRIKGGIDFRRDLEASLSKNPRRLRASRPAPAGWRRGRDRSRR